MCASLSKQRPANGHPSQSEQKNRNHINFECLCNVPDDISTLFALISSKLPSHQTSASETKQEINASRSAFLFVLTCVARRESYGSVVYWPGEERIEHTFTATRREVLAGLW
ncbi:Adh transcription factor 1 [Sarotherodon galilaeus]